MPWRSSTWRQGVLERPDHPTEPALPCLCSSFHIRLLGFVVSMGELYPQVSIKAIPLGNFCLSFPHPAPSGHKKAASVGGMEGVVMEQSEKAKQFLASLDSQALEVGDGSDGLPVWIGIDAEAQKVYKVYACGLVEGFGDGVLISRIGVGSHAGQPADVSTQGKHICVELGEGMSRKLTFFETLDGV